MHKLVKYCCGNPVLNHKLSNFEFQIKLVVVKLTLVRLHNSRHLTKVKDRVEDLGHDTTVGAYVD